MFKIDIRAFVSSLKFMVEGWLGIFVVMAVIIAVVYVLNVLTTKKES